MLPIDPLKRSQVKVLEALDMGVSLSQAVNIRRIGYVQEVGESF